ncbi:NUDIX hydrolase [Bifidobacterium animalis]|uniref:NUDIX hydrolase n=1 Tax=Bifidobacterium animalis TaxID=28025 RepID=UPI0009C2320A|nr:NUDIX domain-containing protein [Bifidobacterium animalis]ARE60273.1 ADP-ribose pyrophosphatase [Bifidobacterium animalis subsp. animalis]MCR1995559.1 NUDIX domain-containing protein [Bifidobacterium animalis subsp. animalis]PHQ54316.1 NUDIX domain-containing protein [Bifidobacterium animalis subsp. animalis]QQQ89886.1 NUDIX domain-containing protein [Bifidobacterium animalis]UQE62946.1 NUDIX domain-containing protein [Bifidobacterium animalis]
MSTPDFILELRKHIGHMPLWLIGITAYVTDGDGRVLLGRRLDTGEWALVYGINEPAEDPADTVAREVREETGVDVIPTDLVSVKASTRMVTYANGDQTQYLDLTYLCRLDPSGNTEPFVGDDENLGVGFFPLDQLPAPLAQSTVERMAYVREYLLNRAHGDAHAQFTFRGEIEHL